MIPNRGHRLLDKIMLAQDKEPLPRPRRSRGTDRCLEMTSMWGRYSFVDRLYFHYDVYRRYPLSPWAALKNAWRMAR
jgi:hypothetical protein